MKKTIVTLVTVGLVAGAFALPADAKKKKKKPVRVERVATGTYQAPQLVIIGTCAQTDAIGCVTFMAAPTEKYLKVTITDAAGLPVSASISQDQVPDTGVATDDFTVATVCGAMEEAVEFDPSYELHVWIDNTPNPNCPGAVATQGTVEIAFSNMP
jgi:hypothetical protein